MMLAPKSGYIKVLCIKSLSLLDVVWGDCSIHKGEWYDAIEDNEYFLIKFGKGVCPHSSNLFLTQEQIRDNRLSNLIDNIK